MRWQLAAQSFTLTVTTQLPSQYYYDKIIHYTRQALRQRHAKGCDLGSIAPDSMQYHKLVSKFGIVNAFLDLSSYDTILNTCNLSAKVITSTFEQ
jgi:hypothetical protein